MPFQKEVRMQQAFGIPGEFYDTSPHRATSYVLESEAVIGRACTLSATEGAMKMGGDGAFAGILISPKQHGRPGSDFAPTMTLPSGTQAQAADKGRLIVILKNAAKPGEAIVYETATGELSAVADAANPGSGKKAVPGARVALFEVTAGGPAVIEM